MSSLAAEKSTVKNKKKLTLMYEKRAHTIEYDDSMRLSDLMVEIEKVTGLKADNQKIVGLTDKLKCRSALLETVKLKKKLRMMKKMSSEEIEYTQKTAKENADKVQFKDETRTDQALESSMDIHGLHHDDNLGPIRKSERGPMWAMAMAMCGNNKEEARNMLLRMPMGMSMTPQMPSAAEMRMLQSNMMGENPNHGTMGPMDAMIMQALMNMSSDERTDFQHQIVGPGGFSGLRDEQDGQLLGHSSVPGVLSRAPNTMVQNVDTGALLRIFDLKGRKDCVLLFLSSALQLSSESMISFFADFSHLTEEFSEHATFACIYVRGTITASNPGGGGGDVHQETTSLLEEGRSYFATLAVDIPCYVDSETNETNIAYHSCPARFYAIVDGDHYLEVGFQGRLGDIAHSNSELRDFLVDRREFLRSDLHSHK